MHMVKVVNVAPAQSTFDVTVAASDELNRLSTLIVDENDRSRCSNHRYELWSPVARASMRAIYTANLPSV